MKMICWAGMGFFIVLLGCAHTQGPRMTLALGSDPEICKHCNCYMPAHLAEESPCPVCECKYAAGQCSRGT